MASLLAPQTEAVTLEDFTRYAAAFIAMLGAFVVSPQGAALLGGRLWTPVRKVGAQLSRWVPFLRRSTTVHAGVASGTLTLTGSARGRARPGWPEQPTVDALATATRDWLGRVDEELNELWSALDGERDRAGTALDGARKELGESIKALEQRMLDAERQAAEHDARALPVVAVGAVMGTISGELASLPLWIYVPVMAAVLGVTLATAASAWRLRHGWVTPKPG